MELSVLLDLVVKITHALVGMPHPELLQTLGALHAIPKMRGTETPECVVARLAPASRPHRGLPAGELSSVVTIGRALRWPDRGATLDALKRIVSERGRVLICGATALKLQRPHS